MIAATFTWSAGDGWSPEMPVPHQADNVLALAFCDDSLVDHDERPVQQLAAAWSDAPLIGCSSAGQLHGDLVLQHTIVVTVLQFANTRVRTAHAELARSGSARRTGRELAEKLAEPGLAAVFVLADGSSVNGTALADGFADVLPDMPVSGGLAGASRGRVGDATWTVVNGQIVHGQVSAAGLFGDQLEIGFGSAGGWEAFGPDRLVTRSFGNVLYELDGRRAADLYLEYVGRRCDEVDGQATDIWLLPLAVKDLDGRVVVRTVRRVNQVDGTLTFNGDIAQGATAQLMRGSVEGLVHGAHLSAKQAATGHERVAIAISSSGRQTLLGERSEDELDAVLQVMQTDVVLVGFHGFGELANVDGTNDVHDQTMTITTLGERLSVSPA